jgi:hypothetical protein
MTLLLAGSVLLIGGSAAALVVGWINANESFIWTSIGATAAAAALLIVAFFRSRKEAPSAATAAPGPESLIDPEILADREERSKQKYQRAMTRGEEEAAASADETKVSEPSEEAEADEDDDGEWAPAPGTVVTSTSLGGATAATPTPGDPQTDPDATAATVGPPAGAADQTDQSGPGTATTGSGQVVAVPKTKKFHSAGCRFASAKGAETMDRAAAEERGFQPCGVCKP